MTDRTRVVVTGLGAVSALGVCVDVLFEGLAAGRSGIGPITRFDASDYTTRIAGEVPDFDLGRWLPPGKAKKLDRFTQFAMVAGIAAWEDSGLDSDQIDDIMAGREPREPGDWGGDSGDDSNAAEKTPGAPDTGSPIGGPAGEH